MKKKFLALVMTLSMVLSLVPMTALAAGDQPTEEPTQGTQADVQVGQKEEPTVSVAEKEGAEDNPMVQETPATSYAAKGTTFTSESGVKYEVIDDREVIVTGCSKETVNLIIPKTVSYHDVDYTIVAIADQAFDLLEGWNKGAENVDLAYVDLNGATLTIGENAFRYCKNLVKVVGAENVTEVKYGAFSSCDKLESISKLSSLTSIGKMAFSYCTSLTSLDGLELSSIISIGDKAFWNDTSLSFNLEEDTFESLQTLGESSFSGCTSVIGKVILPERITEIPNNAFSGTRITEVDFSNITSIGNSAFSNCADLKELKLSDSIITIGDKAFKGTGISGELILPDSITTIGSCAFQMTGISSVKWSHALKTIGAQAFHKCLQLGGALNLPEGVTNIGKAAFASTAITELQLPDSLQTISDSAFENCTQLTSVQIGEKNCGASNLVSIGQRAFWKDTGITSFKIEACSADVNIAPDVSPTKPTIEPGVTVEFTVQVDGENIYQGNTETTLQKAINDVEENGSATITPDKSFFVDDTVTIPAGKTITLTDNGTGLSVLTKSGFNKPLFVVEEDAKLILSGAFTYPCFRMTSGVFAQVKGDLILESGTISRLSSTQTETGVIDVKGGSFKMEGGTISDITASDRNFGAVYIHNKGTFSMEGGTISKFKSTNQYAGPVVVNGGSMTMSGGKIDGNTATEFNSAGGVLVNTDSTFTMTGGTISNNSAKRGGGVLVRENGQFKMPEMSKGTISGNTARVESDSIAQPNAGGGGVFVEGDASFEMEDGTITRNTTNGMGGGVATAVLNEDDKTGGGQFHMTGGTISNNEASCGGGVYSWSGKDRVVLEGGNIVNNTAYNQGGGVYVSTSPYGLTIKNALITDNKATIMGGGVWACPTGTVTLGTDSAVFDNTATKAGDDIALLNKNEGYYSTFSNEQLGGGLVTWYKDNFVTGNQSQWGSNGDYRYDANDPGNPVISATNSMSSYSLKAVVSNDGKSLAKNAAKLFIQRNTAQRGGGVGTNGEINFSGDNTPQNPISVTVHKVWSGNNGNYPSTVKVNLVRTKNDESQTIATVILSEKSKDKEDTPEEKGKTWSYIFSNLDDSYTYTVTEDEVPGYRTNITKNTEGNNLTFTITNTRKGGGGSGGGGTVTIPDDVPTGLDLKNHYGYIIGYPVDYYTGKPTTDQTKKPVRPEGKITRAEVATIYFRMLTDENRAANWNQVSGFSDVKRSAWYNNAISTLTKAGILKGYEDGTFQPDGYITRAEFATIAIRFFSGVYEGEDLFPDIKGHWAEDYINNAANKGLVKGYEDGTFGPDRYITRAEAVTLVNRTLNRHPHNDGLHQDMLRWPDNMDTSKWYYADMQEATNSHEPDKDKTTADKEYWGKMLPIRDWEALEKEWSNANSAPGEGEVV